ncbi:MAG: hypothetical protein K5984_02785 [Bacteroidales bacterium]|nr:hypothetical protein [Bacteroidales bacterium]
MSFSSKMNSRGKIVIALTTAFFAAVGFLFSITTPKSYTTAAVLAPEVVNRQLPITALSGLTGSLMGEAANYSSDAIKIYFYPSVVTSIPFLVDLLKTPVRTADGKVETTLEDYLDNHQKSSLLSKIKNAPGKLLPEKEKGREVTVSDSLKGEVEVFTISEELYDKVMGLSGSISAGVNYRNRKITISYKAQDPLVSYMVCCAIIDNLDKYVKDYRVSKFNEIYEFLLEYVKIKRDEAYQAQERLAEYEDSHGGLHTEESRTRVKELTAERDFAMLVMNQVDASVETVRIRMEKPVPVFEAINPPFLPNRHSGPTPLRDALTYAIIGLLLSSSFVLLEDKLFRR